MTKQLEQTIAKIEALPPDSVYIALQVGKALTKFCPVSELHALAAEVKRLTEYVQELADHGFEKAREILDGGSND